MSEWTNEWMKETILFPQINLRTIHCPRSKKSVNEWTNKPVREVALEIFMTR